MCSRVPFQEIFHGHILSNFFIVIKNFLGLHVSDSSTY